MLSIIRDCFDFDKSACVIEEEMLNMKSMLYSEVFMKLLREINRQLENYLWVEHYGDDFLFYKMRIISYEEKIVIYRTSYLLSTLISIPDDFDYVFMEGAWYEI